MGVKWSTVDEIRLFKWVAQFKPAGIHKHFHMRCILERLNNPDDYPVTLLQSDEPRKTFSAQDVWEKLAEYYDLQQADLVEGMQVGEDAADDGAPPGGFSLPWGEYGELMLHNARADGAGDDEAEPDAGAARDDADERPRSSAGSTGARTRRQTRQTRSQQAGSDDEKPSAPPSAPDDAPDDEPDEDGDLPPSKKPRTRAHDDAPGSSASDSPAARTRRKAVNPPVQRRLRTRR
ncbi:AFR063Wp [Eremothecium gossypii ATCC 10895]|uniref:Chromatin modification-related protein EAF7 n=1 Tax=Eremothecium gossypii (strain ATCC 10895 / CBS 109.51 / FGSC 9923 / NRRL Y-1056) TaxID=284811 RepID=Q754K9_EREGS|nr:AFR063Wp [Eremothecium gossypii ATCC 10895]AAS53434.1 AFR063Wp [Eremothecium gossypii ATCC 10895]